MSNLSGTWRFTQKWGSSQPYSFDADFKTDGTIVINSGGVTFNGTYAILGSSNQIALAIADFQGTPQSITSYVGNIVGGAMGGEAVGDSIGGSSVQGTWSAQEITGMHKSKGYHVPVEAA
ncbi:MAG: hypothetical protein AAF806_19515 [Bacteroidota bacterium]